MNTDEEKPEDVGALMLRMAENMKDPVAREEARANAMKYIHQEKQRKNEFLGRYVVGKILDIATIALLIALIWITVRLFNESLLEGLIAAVVGFFFFRFIFKRRMQDFFSWFCDWR